VIATATRRSESLAHPKAVAPDLVVGSAHEVDDFENLRRWCAAPRPSRRASSPRFFGPTIRVELRALDDPRPVEGPHTVSRPRATQHLERTGIGRMRRTACAATSSCARSAENPYTSPLTRSSNASRAVERHSAVTSTATNRQHLAHGGELRTRHEGR